MADAFDRYLAALLLDAINARYETALLPSDASDGTLVATDGEHRIALAIGALWEREAAADWEERLRTAAARLEPARGRYLLWVPPRASVPVEEPAATEFASRVQLAMDVLQPGARTEVRFPVTVRMGKLREEGGYASVAGGLSRWWTRITEKVDGTFQVDSTAVHRLTSDGAAREEIWDAIGDLSKGVAVGAGVDFEIDEAWTLQRLPDAPDDAGIAIVGAPPEVDQTDGVLLRRMVRKRLAAASEALRGVDARVRAAGLVGSYEYAEVENASATVKSVGPALLAGIEVVAILADGETRPVLLPRALPSQ